LLGGFFFIKSAVVEKAIEARTFWGAPLRATFPTVVGPKNFTTPSQPLYPVFGKRATTIGRRAGHAKAAASKCARSIEIRNYDLYFNFFTFLPWKLEPDWRGRSSFVGNHNLSPPLKLDTKSPEVIMGGGNAQKSAKARQMKQDKMGKEGKGAWVSRRHALCKAQRGYSERNLLAWVTH
jgi:hypothetical protein